MCVIFIFFRLLLFVHGAHLLYYFFLRGYSIFTNLFILPTIFHSGDHPRINKISHEWTGRSLCGAMETAWSVKLNDFGYAKVFFYSVCFFFYFHIYFNRKWSKDAAWTWLTTSGIWFHTLSFPFPLLRCWFFIYFSIVYFIVFVSVSIFFIKYSPLQNTGTFVIGSMKESIHFQKSNSLEIVN